MFISLYLKKYNNIIRKRAKTSIKIIVTKAENAVNSADNTHTYSHANELIIASIYFYHECYIIIK